MRTGSPGHTVTGKRVAGCITLRGPGVDVPVDGVVLLEELDATADCGSNHPLLVEVYTKHGDHLGGWCPWCGTRMINEDRIAEATHFIFTVLNGF